MRHVLSSCLPTTKLRVALVRGGAESHQVEYEQALELCTQAGVEPTVFMVNDQMEDHPGPGVAVSLQPAAKLMLWLQTRSRRGYPQPTQIWTHRPGFPAYITQDWGGSTGLLAVKVALFELKLDVAILCGVPMSAVGNHYRRHQPWGVCDTFHRGWNSHHDELKGRVKSFSGWTAERLGQPTLEFLQGEPFGSSTS